MRLIADVSRRSGKLRGLCADISLVERIVAEFLVALLLSSLCTAAAKPHVISFGKAVPAKFFADADETQPLSLKVRALYVDAKLREFTIGVPHEITDRVFSVRRAFRVNDLLPDENAATPRWQWQLGGWLLVDRLTGHISAVALPDFDVYLSVVGWYRDYAAYCGMVENGSTKRFSAVVVQVARRKPLLKKSIDGAGTDQTTQACTSPRWQRQPPQVTFGLASGKSVSYAIHGQVADLVAEEDDSGEE